MEMNGQPVVSVLTGQERATLREAAFGAVALVSNADPGFFAMLRESFAASGAMPEASPLVREVLGSGSLPRLPGSSQADLAAVVLPALRSSVLILRAKAPGEEASFAATVLSAVQRAAVASHGVRAPEQAMLDQVRGALES